MCFYNQHRFVCGDWKWAHFRERCYRESRPSKTCGLKLVMQTIAVDAKCDICNQIDARQQQRVTEMIHIYQLRRSGLFTKASMDNSCANIKVLDKEIYDLPSEHQTRSQLLGGVVDETPIADCYSGDQPLCDQVDVRQRQRATEMNRIHQWRPSELFTKAAMDSLCARVKVLDKEIYDLSSERQRTAQLLRGVIDETSGISRSKIGEVQKNGVIASDTTHHIAVIVDTGMFSRNLRLFGLTDFDILRLQVGIKRPKKRTKTPKGLPAFSSNRKHTFKDREEFLISKLVERHPEFADNLAQELPLKSAKSHGKPVWSGLQGLVSAARAQLHNLNLKISNAADLGSSDDFKASDEKNFASVATHSSRKGMYLPPSVTCQGRKQLFNAGFTFRNKPVYDSDGDSVLSVSDNLFSIATESSQSSVKFQEAVDEFFVILIRDTRIRALSPKAIRIMDAEEVKRNLVRLLWLYASDLRSEARSTFEEAASRLFRRYSASLALRVTRSFDQREGCSAEVQEPEKGIVPSGMDMINLPDGEDSGNSGAKEVDQFAKVRSFMVDRSPFLKLRNNFQDFVNTTSALSLPSPTSGVRHWTTTGSIQRIPGVHQLTEVFLLREPSSNLGFDVVNEAVFFCTFSSVPKQLSTPLAYFINLFRDYTASGDAAASARLAERPRLDSPEGVFQDLADQFWRHNGTAKGLPNAKVAPLSCLRYRNSGKQASPEMTASDPFYSLNVFFSNIAFSEMNFLSKMQRGSESDLIDSSIVKTTSIISLISRKKVVHLNMKMLQQNLHLLKSRAGFGWTQDSEAGDWSQADARTQRLQLDFQYLSLRTKYLSGQCDHDLNSIMRSAMIRESRKAISQTSSTVRNLTRLALLCTPLSFLASLFGINVLKFCMEENITILSGVMFATLFVANFGVLFLLDTSSALSRFSSYVSAYTKGQSDYKKHHHAGDPGRPRRSISATFTGMSVGESKWDGSYSHQAQVVHQPDGADKSNCAESSSLKGASGQPEALSIYQKNAKRLLTVARMSVLPPIIHSYMAHCRFISFGCLTPDTSQLDIEENGALYHCPASLIRKSACVYKILALFQRWTSMSLRSSFQSGGAWLLGFAEYITRSIIQRLGLSFVKRQAIGTVLVGLWKHSALTERLGLSEPSLGNGMKRVRWTCRCGQRLHDDFIELREGAAQEMEHSLNQAMRTRPHRDQQASGQPFNLGTRAMSSLKGFFGQNTSLTSNNGLPQHNVLLQGQAPKLVTPRFQSEGRWLLVCAKIGRYATKLSQMDVCATTSDKDLFTELRKAYIEFKSKWTRLLNLRGIKSIHFVQFELHRKELVDIRKEPDMPSGERRKEYLYETCELLPPLGENYMMHLFHHPEDGDDEFLTCLRVPKKRHEKLKVCQQRGIVVGWGLHLVEGWLLNRVWILVLVLFVLGSLLFGICWSTVKHDIQGAFGVSSWILALAIIVIENSVNARVKAIDSSDVAFRMRTPDFAFEPELLDSVKRPIENTRQTPVTTSQSEESTPGSDCSAASSRICKDPMSKSTSENTLDREARTSHTVLSKSARGATFLILLQIGSRALTFVVNQVLLRYLSPELLGISTQLELYTISVLYFARESLRVALQRQRSDAVQADVSDDPVLSGKEGEQAAGRVSKSYAPAREAQEVVNLSYIAIALGVPLAYGLGQLYLRSAEPSVLAAPYFHVSLNIYTLATFIELLAEPCFAVASRQMLYGSRASAEASATFTRCVLTCFAAIWASRNNRDIGVLPFAIGQISYASVLCLIYYSQIWHVSAQNHFSLLLKPISTGNPNQYILSLFSRPLITLSSNLYAQSGLKHILTQGDSLLIASLASLSSQGTYALASNYGGLLARTLFQPIEESSRGLFGRLLSPTLSPTNPSSTTTTSPPNPSPEGLASARTYLLTLLRLYLLLSSLILPLGPTLSPLLLRLLLGSQWTSPATAAVLAAYCYYIPLLALNGILEAFVAAVASPTELRQQSLWMLAFSAGFAGAGYLLLGVYGLGARGLVLANAVNMAMRIWWSAGFVEGWLRREGVGVRWGECAPSWGTGVLGVAVAGGMRVLERGFDGGWGDLVKCVGVAGGYGIMLLFFERKFLLQCYQMLRPPKDETKKKI